MKAIIVFIWLNYLKYALGASGGYQLSGLSPEEIWSHMRKSSLESVNQHTSSLVKNLPEKHSTHLLHRVNNIEEAISVCIQVLEDLLQRTRLRIPHANYVQLQCPYPRSDIKVVGTISTRNEDLLDIMKRFCRLVFSRMENKFNTPLQSLIPSPASPFPKYPHTPSHTSLSTPSSYPPPYPTPPYPTPPYPTPPYPTPPYPTPPYPTPPYTASPPASPPPPPPPPLPLPLPPPPLGSSHSTFPVHSFSKKSSQVELNPQSQWNRLVLATNPRRPGSKHITKVPLQVYTTYIPSNTVLGLVDSCIAVLTEIYLQSKTSNSYRINMDGTVTFFVRYIPQNSDNLAKDELIICSHTLSDQVILNKIKLFCAAAYEEYSKPPDTSAAQRQWTSLVVASTSMGHPNVKRLPFHAPFGFSASSMVQIKYFECVKAIMILWLIGTKKTEVMHQEKWQVISVNYLTLAGYTSFGQFYILMQRNYGQTIYDVILNSVKWFCNGAVNNGNKIPELDTTFPTIFYHLISQNSEKMESKVVGLPKTSPSFLKDTPRPIESEDGIALDHLINYCERIMAIIWEKGNKVPFFEGMYRGTRLIFSNWDHHTTTPVYLNLKNIEVGTFQTSEYFKSFCKYILGIDQYSSSLPPTPSSLPPTPSSLPPTPSSSDRQRFPNKITHPKVLYQNSAYTNSNFRGPLFSQWELLQQVSSQGGAGSNFILFLPNSMPAGFTYSNNAKQFIESCLIILTDLYNRNIELKYDRSSNSLQVTSLYSGYSTKNSSYPKSSHTCFLIKFSSNDKKSTGLVTEDMILMLFTKFCQIAAQVLYGVSETYP
ncbi:hypothetical protein ACR3K2_18750 [Cryptosporidium serpentis]